MGRTLGPSVDFVLLEVVLGKDFKINQGKTQSNKMLVRFIIAGDTIHFRQIGGFLSVIPLLLRNAFKLVRYRRHLADGRRGGVAS